MELVLSKQDRPLFLSVCVDTRRFSFGSVLSSSLSATLSMEIKWDFTCKEKTLRNRKGITGFQY